MPRRLERKCRHPRGRHRQIGHRVNRTYGSEKTRLEVQSFDSVHDRVRTSSEEALPEVDFDQGQRQNGSDRQRLGMSRTRTRRDRKRKTSDSEIGKAKRSFCAHQTK